MPGTNNPRNTQRSMKLPDIVLDEDSSAQDARADKKKRRRNKSSKDPSGASSRRSKQQTDETAAQVSSIRIGDIERERRRYERSMRMSYAPVIVTLIVGLIAILLVVVFVVLPRFGVFGITNIEVKGAEHLTTTELSQLISVPVGTTLLDVDTDSISSSLMRDAWVKNVDIKRVFPDTLEIDITEREIAAIVEVPIGATQTIQNWAISSEGMWLMVVPSQSSAVGSTLSNRIYEDAADALRITGVPYGAEPKIGVYCVDDNINNALEITQGMTTELADRVKSVSATDAESALLTLDNGIEIAFGTADNIREKERVCLQILEENPEVVYINVRVVDRPTWRAA